MVKKSNTLRSSFKKERRTVSTVESNLAITVETNQLLVSVSRAESLSGPTTPVSLSVLSSVFILFGVSLPILPGIF